MCLFFFLFFMKNFLSFFILCTVFLFGLENVDFSCFGAYFLGLDFLQDLDLLLLLLLTSSKSRLDFQFRFFFRLSSTSHSTCFPFFAFKSKFWFSDFVWYYISSVFTMFYYYLFLINVLICAFLNASKSYWPSKYFLKPECSDFKCSSNFLATIFDLSLKVMYYSQYKHWIEGQKYFLCYEIFPPI